jgi:hypothetical protein
LTVRALEPDDELLEDPEELDELDDESPPSASVR